jgi:hypothetical protein
VSPYCECKSRDPQNDANRAIVFTIVPGQLIDQRALSRSGRSGQANDSCMTSMRKQGFEQIRPTGISVLDGADGACERAGIARAQLPNQWLEVVTQTASVKQPAEIKGKLFGLSS